MVHLFGTAMVTAADGQPTDHLKEVTDGSDRHHDLCQLFERDKTYPR